MRKYFLVTLEKDYYCDDILIDSKNTVLVDLFVENESNPQNRLRDYFKSRVVLNIDEIARDEYILFSYNTSMQSYRPNL